MVGYIALGSNCGDRRAHLAAGLRGLGQSGLPLLAVSSVWETEPVGAPEPSPWFLNMVVAVCGGADPPGLLRLLLDIERRAGRTRSAPNAPRTLDLDLLMLGTLVVRQPGLELPHPRMWQRRFVLEPLAEIAPGLVNPATGRTVDEERRNLRDGPRVQRVGRLATPRDLPL